MIASRNESSVNAITVASGGFVAMYQPAWGARQICDGYAREVREWDIGADF